MVNPLYGNLQQNGSEPAKDTYSKRKDQYLVLF